MAKRPSTPSLWMRGSTERPSAALADMSRSRHASDHSDGAKRGERVVVFGTDQRITSGSAATVAASRWRQAFTRKQAAYMAAPERFAKRQIPLAPRAPSIHGPKMVIWRSWSCASVSGLLTEPLNSWPSWISARVRSHSRLGPEGQMGHLITNALARPFSISFSDSQTLAGKPTITFGDQPKPSAIRLVNLSAFIRLLPS